MANSHPNLITAAYAPTAKVSPTPKVRDDIELDGGHYFLSRKAGKWAIRKDGDWVYLDNSYSFNYLGPDSFLAGQSKWRLAPKVAGDRRVTHSLLNFSVTITINKHTDTFSVKARNENHARLLGLGEMSRRLNMSIPSLRSRLLPDAFVITQT